MVFLSSVSHCNKWSNPRRGSWEPPTFIADQLGAQVTTWTFSWHLKCSGGSLINWTLNLWDLILTPGSLTIKLNSRTSSWCPQRTRGLLGAGKLPTHLQYKSILWVVIERKKNGVFFFFLSPVAWNLYYKFVFKAK